MIGILVLIAAVTIIAKTADMEGRSSFAWGAMTLNICIACMVFIPLPLLNVVIGCVISFLILFAVKIIKK